ncbi:MAG: crossover junction endodeoxyribonuclease RuvC [Planctomycetota bacterium]
MRILGIDPGLNTTGYAVLEFANGSPRVREAGIVRTRARQTLERRLAEIHEGTSDLIAALEPQVMAVEELFSHYKRPRTAILMGHARGVICLAAARAGISVNHYAATQVKKMLTGSGHATKQQIQWAICREFSLAEPPQPADVADALAIALCHLYTDKNKANFP